MERIYIWEKLSLRAWNFRRPRNLTAPNNFRMSHSCLRNAMRWTMMSNCFLAIQISRIISNEPRQTRPCITEKLFYFILKILLVSSTLFLFLIFFFLFLFLFFFSFLKSCSFCQTLFVPALMSSTVSLTHFLKH